MVWCTDSIGTKGRYDFNTTIPMLPLFILCWIPTVWSASKCLSPSITFVQQGFHGTFEITLDLHEIRIHCIDGTVDAFDTVSLLLKTSHEYFYDTFELKRTLHPNANVFLRNGTLDIESDASLALPQTIDISIHLLDQSEFIHRIYLPMHFRYQPASPDASKTVRLENPSIALSKDGRVVWTSVGKYQFDASIPVGYTGDSVWVELVSIFILCITTCSILVSLRSVVMITL